MAASSTSNGVRPEGTTDVLPSAETFDQPDFDAAAWLNSCTSTHSGDDVLHSLARAVDESLHESHLSLEKSLARALTAVPWAVRESEKVRQRANTLRANVDGVGERVAGVEAGVASSVDTIARADEVVRRVEEVSRLLGLAANADRLQTRLEALLASSGADGADLVAAADVLARLRGELQPLADIHELAGRFRSLETADAKLESLAAPQLRRALEGRNGAAAANARIVFDRAGRENAFAAQYVAIRAAQVSKLWGDAWSSWADAAISPPAGMEAAAAEEASAKLRSTRRALKGDISADGAQTVLAGFYANLRELLHTEAVWLDSAFPDLRRRLLPSLLVAALNDVRDPPLRKPVVDADAPADEKVARARAVPDRMHTAAKFAVNAAAGVCTALLPPWGDPLLADESFAALAVEAVSAALAPHRLFLDSAAETHSRAAKVAADAIEISTEGFFTQSRQPRPRRNSGTGGGGGGLDNPPPTPPRIPPPALSEVARDLENVAAPAVAILDDAMTSITCQTVGTGMGAMTRAAGAVAQSLSDRLLRILQHPQMRSGGGGASDEWGRVSAALRLLRAVSALKRSWDGRKEAGLALAIGAAGPVLESASNVSDSVESRLQQFVFAVEADEVDAAAVVWQLVADPGLPKRVISTFENANTRDFAKVLEAAHRVVYENIMAGVQNRFKQFGDRALWAAEAGDPDAATLGSSTSPLPYATEVADFLMTVPQQLEPFVPDEEDAAYATPASVYAFSTRAAPEKRQDAEEEETVNTSFAGMWIHVLAVGTMEMYMEKIFAIAKLSEIGTRQLAVDTEYICNVLSALGVNPTEEISLVRRLLECPKDGGEFAEAAKGVVSADQRKLVRRVAAVRGLSVSL